MLKYKLSIHVRIVRYIIRIIFFQMVNSIESVKPGIQVPKHCCFLDILFKICEHIICNFWDVCGLKVDLGLFIGFPLSNICHSFCTSLCCTMSYGLLLPPMLLTLCFC